MIVFPNCKINLGLFITGRRPDGFHDLQTVFYPLRWNDALEVVRTEKDHTKIFITGDEVDIDNNICVKAWRLLEKNHKLPPVHIHLHKNIPVGAGLGGGSADGAFTLMLLNDEFQLHITGEQMAAYALQLGSDCPFFIRNRPCFATGRGENLKEISLSLGNYFFMIVYPGIHVSTAEAFSNIIVKDHRQNLEEIVAAPVETWKEKMRNDFEPTVFRRHPEIAELKEQLYRSGALYASMSGSGSSVYGIFSAKPEKPSFPPNYRVEILPG